MKKIYIANWKSNLGLEASKALAKSYLEGGIQNLEGEVFAAPSHFVLSSTKEILENSGIKIFAQDASIFPEAGAFTGDVISKHLKDFGIVGSLVGHSERRVYLGETNQVLNKKVSALLKNEMVAVYCFGETAEERTSGKTFEVLKQQLEEGTANLEDANENNLYLAYEPVWAISTFPGAKEAKYADVEEVMNFVRNWAKEKFSFGNKMKFLYGGSVKPENAKEYKTDLIDGFVMGGAGLDANKLKGVMEA